ncbi:tetratricopeptide repeat protein [Roseibium sp. MMSF_3544]|uniref:tetratricopeptide repeat protein n=1 Tax=unclassified Roseibium TaxID=2629323 RepID=UPI00273EEA10|nr:tetratricopeptide repeat protein [Roseibium sp. MMSF_3544]
MWWRNQFSALAVSVVLLTGCQSGDLANLSTYGDSAASNHDLSKVAYYPDDELLTRANVQFKEKNFGKAYAIYKRAVEVYPKDPVAWLGYSASADMIGRFDNADTGYKRLARMIPNRPEYLNNVGYSYLLRGNLVSARRYFLKAYDIDPANQTTANNLELLRNSVSFANRG